MTTTETQSLSRADALDQSAWRILEEIKQHSAETGARGAWFDFGDGEICSANRITKRLFDTCWFIAELISKGYKMELGVNANKQVSVRVRR